jgi:hypothetical protein
MSETSQQTQSETLQSTTNEKPEISQKPSDSVSLLNETEEAKPETKTEAKPGDKPDGVPDKYSDFKLPDGVELSPEVLTEATTMFKELGLSQTNAQRLVDFHTKSIQATADAVSKTSIDSWLAQKAEWKTQIKSDPEIGGKLGEVKATIGKLYESLGDAKLVSEFRTAMDLTGAGDNPAFIRTFFKIASRLTEGSHVAGDTPKPKPMSAAQAMYPNLPSKAG